MFEFLSPYKKEGFLVTSGGSSTPSTPPPTDISGASQIDISGASQIDISGAMEKVFSQLITIKATDTSKPPTSFLKTIITQQEDTTDALMNTANKITPIAKTMIQMESAYDAAFESDTQAPLPGVGGTFQSFVLLFFVVSYWTLALASTFLANAVSGSRAAAGTFACFFVLSIILLAIILRVG